MLLVHGGESTDAGAQHDGDPLGGDAADEGLGHGPGLAGGQQGQLGAAIGAAPQQWLQSIEGGGCDLTGDAHAEVIGPAVADHRDSRAALQAVSPGLVWVLAEW